MTAWASLEEALTLGWGVERAFVCPTAHSENAHASVNSFTGWWFCYSCHAKGRADFDNLNIDPQVMQKQIDRMGAELRPAHEWYSETYLDLFDRQPPWYWLDRFEPEVVADHRLGEDLTNKCATIPFRSHSGGVLGVIRRDLTGQDPQKYRYPFGLSVSWYLYNYHRCTKGWIILTEGPTDAVAAEEAGWKDTMALYGNSLSRDQARSIAKYAPERVLVALDQDKGGEIGYERVVRRLGKDFRVERVRWDDYKDLAEMPLAERRELLQKITSPRRVLKVVKTTTG